MEQEYTVSNGKKTFYYIIAGVIFIASACIYFIPKNPNVSPAVYLLPLALMMVPVLIILGTTKRKVTVCNDRIICTTIFRTSELALADVKGYRMTQYKGSPNVVLEPVSPNQSKLVISNIGDLTDKDSLVEWVTNNFKDLDAVDIQREQEELSQNTALGFTEEERQASLKKAKAIAMTYNVLSLGCLALLFFNTKPNLIALMVYPFIGVLLMIYYKDLIKFFVTAKRSIYPSVAMGVVTPCLALFFKSIAAYDLLRTDTLWMPALLLGGAMFIVLFFTAVNRSTPPVAGQAILLMVIALLYSFGSILQINFVYDDSELQVYHATVFNRRVSHGKSNSYYLRLSKWGPQDKVKEVNVSRSLYDDTEVGDTVKISLKQGKFNIPWFTINK